MSNKNFRIVSHNAYWFQGVPFEGTNPGSPAPAIFAGLIEVYRSLQPDLLCLQEVQSAEVAEQLADALGMHAFHTPGKVRTQYGVASLTSRTAGVADWQAHGKCVDRAWQLICVEVAPRTTLTVANVHLPSGRQTSPEQTRRLQRAELLDVIGFEPDVLCGDLNDSPGGIVTETMQASGYVDAACLRRRENLPSNIAGWRGDYIWVHGRDANSVIEYGAFAGDFRPAEATGKTFLSDHLPIWIDLAGCEAA